MSNKAKFASSIRSLGGSAAEFLAMNGFDPECLRTCDILRKDEWQFLDERLIGPTTQRRGAIADLQARGLTLALPNAMGITELQHEVTGDMDPAQESMDGLNRTDNDGIDFKLNTTPVYITHKDFYINLRHLEASRNKGQPLDTSQLELSGRLLAERLETTLFDGSSVTVNGNTGVGYRNAAGRITSVSFLTTTWSDIAKTGEDMLSDVLNMIAAMNAENFFGPFIIYAPLDAQKTLGQDFKANSDKSVLDRLLEVEDLEAIRISSFMTTAELLMVQMTTDVVRLVEGLQPTIVQWDMQGGFRKAFKVMSIMIPEIRNPNDSIGATTPKTGIVHIA